MALFGLGKKKKEDEEGLNFEELEKEEGLGEELGARLPELELRPRAAMREAPQLEATRLGPAPVPKDRIGFEERTRFPEPVGIAELPEPGMLGAAPPEKKEPIDPEQLKTNIEILNSKLDMLKIQLDTIDQTLRFINAKLK